MLGGEAITGAKAMGARISFSLSVEARKGLERIVRRGQNWRERERAQTLLLLDEGLLPEVVADRLGLHVRTVGTTRNRWMDTAWESLADLPRSGAPRKLVPEQVERIAGWAREQPQSAVELLAKHKEHGGVAVHPSTLHAALKAAGLVWKRTRHSLKKNAMRPPSGRQL